MVPRVTWISFVRLHDLEQDEGLDHVKRAVRQVDEAHHPEHERQPRGHEKQASGQAARR
jgi:hypothetical protein